MKTTFDPAKDAANQSKHGFSLAQASDVDLETALTFVDDRKDYGEERLVSIADMSGETVVLVWVETESGIRAISLRKANNREKRKFKEFIDG